MICFSSKIQADASCFFDDSSFHPCITDGREPSEAASQISLWVEDSLNATEAIPLDTEAHHMTSLEELSCPQDFLNPYFEVSPCPEAASMSPQSPGTSLPSTASTASLDNILDQR